jgi:hypothetical protein
MHEDQQPGEQKQLSTACGRLGPAVPPLEVTVKGLANRPLSASPFFIGFSVSSRCPCPSYIAAGPCSAGASRTRFRVQLEKIALTGGPAVRYRQESDRSSFFSNVTSVLPLSGLAEGRHVTLFRDQTTT